MKWPHLRQPQQQSLYLKRLCERDFFLLWKSSIKNKSMRPIKHKLLPDEKKLPLSKHSLYMDVFLKESTFPTLLTLCNVQKIIPFSSWSNCLPPGSSVHTIVLFTPSKALGWMHGAGWDEKESWGHPLPPCPSWTAYTQPLHVHIYAHIISKTKNKTWETISIGQGRSLPGAGELISNVE